jgi:glutaminyl-tRNA synthetase
MSESPIAPCGCGETETRDNESSNFIEDIIRDDLASGKHTSIATRFPPEPNGYLHIGHAKSICLNFGLARKFGGTCNLRFDDTNPSTEDQEYVDSIQEDIRWLGFDWGERRFFGSDYFDTMYDYAIELIEKGLAYVDSCTLEQIRDMRGDYNRPGVHSPYRERSVAENLEMFRKMRAGEYPEGSHVLRAKIDMSSPNMNLRDPIMYRIRHASHHRTGDKWCIYPMYDWAHGFEDALEGITHSICTLEFENHRPLYNWFIENVSTPCHPRQIEFARLNLTYTVMSKRKLLELVKQGHVSGWEDPRMPTICGLRRRGMTPASLRKFCDRIGVARRDSIVDVALLEHAVREDLNDTSPRVMAVLDPLRVVIENFPEGAVEWFDAPFHPEDPSWGSRKVPFSKVIYIEKDDFREVAPKKWFRLSPGAEIRLRYACLIRCTDVIKDPKTGEVVELRCTWDPNSRGGTSPDGRVVRGTSHWVSAAHAIDAEVRLYDRLFQVEDPLDVEEGQHFTKHLNPNSLEVLRGCKLEPCLADAAPEARFQFERLGYFCADRRDHVPGQNLVFNRTVTLKDGWARVARANERDQKGSGKPEPRKTEAQSATGPTAVKEEAAKTEITIEDFGKLDLRVAVIREASLVEGADKLLRLMVDVGEDRLRQVFAGIRAAYAEPEKLVGRKVIVVANLKPRKMKFGLSEGMVLAGSGDDRLAVATFDADVLPGDTVS